MHIVRNNLPNFFNRHSLFVTAEVLGSIGTTLFDSRILEILHTTIQMAPGVYLARSGLGQIREGNNPTQRIIGSAKLLGGGILSTFPWLSYFTTNSPKQLDFNAIRQELRESFRRHEFAKYDDCRSGDSTIRLFQAQKEGGTLEKLCTESGEAVNLLHKCWSNGTETTQVM